MTVGAANVELRASLVSSPTRSPTASASGRGSCSRSRRCRPPASSSPAASCAGPTGSPCRRLSTEEGLTRIEAEAGRVLPEAGWNIRTRLNADPRFARNIERFTQFLTLVGLTALLVGGVGVANAVRGFVDRKRASIATLKSLGAPGGQVVMLYLTQVMLIAASASASGWPSGRPCRS